MPHYIEDCLQVCADWGLIPTEFRQCMTWEEQVLWLTKFLKEQVIPQFNGLSDQVNALQAWFDNLDVQEEINNKLDEMAESGELADIIAQYLQLAGVLAFGTIADLSAAENLANGSTARVLGNTSAADGDGAYYVVRNLVNTDTVDGYNLVGLTNYPALVAERITDANDILKNLSKTSVETYYPDFGENGDFQVLICKYGNETKNIIIDFGAYDDNDAAYNATIAKLQAKGATKFDYAVISHYHGDHVGRALMMLADNRLDFSECTFYLPPTPDYTQFVGSARYIPDNEQAIMDALNAAGITYVQPDLNTVVSINPQTSMHFYNCDETEFSNYYNVTEVVDGVTVTLYNNFSMVAEVDHLNNRLVFSGDIEKAAETVILEQGLQRPNLYKIQHHGINGTSNSNTDRTYLQRIFGDINIVENPGSVQECFSVYPNLYNPLNESGDTSVFSDGFAVSVKSEGGQINGMTSFADFNYTKGIRNTALDLAPSPTGNYESTIPNAANLDTYTTPGCYICTGSDVFATLTNVPVLYANTGFKLYVDNLNDIGRIRQFIHPMGNPFIYYRTGLVREGTNTWTLWSVLPSYGYAQELKAGDDLNNLPIGEYVAGTGTIAQGIYNRPTGVTSSFHVVCKITTDYYVNGDLRLNQELTTNASPTEKFFRAKTGTGWAKWRKITTTEVDPVAPPSP